MDYSTPTSLSVSKSAIELDKYLQGRNYDLSHTKEIGSFIKKTAEEFSERGTWSGFDYDWIISKAISKRDEKGLKMADGFSLEMNLLALDLKNPTSIPRERVRALLDFMVDFGNEILENKETTYRHLAA